ncbi:hypothetical protein GCM10007860_20870 [Chitiniphilus shinanonensis]|uniref:EF-hand domain-containing protein n=1 Tax=Chitiniphilus shinanonensis TaxID=553088 RepID=A0ABQ6BYH1_9NEIS|nr:EF-hand domain-containing protein [Chitiniphilus shinanonensis]GLS04938.1 hypothetical protein GCM10007860_20870 [Chitiniphilus shinanonensis]
MKRWTIGVVAMALAAGAVMAADGWGGKDGAPRDISRADFVKGAEARFDAMDANKDGVVTQAERQAAWKTRAEHFRQMRGDVTEAQYLEAAKARFQRLDSDKNGVLSADERGHHGQRGNFRHAGMMMPRGDMTRADFVKHAEARFDALDTDKNGVVTVAEFQAAHPHWKGGAKAR